MFMHQRLEHLKSQNHDQKKDERIQLGIYTFNRSKLHSLQDLELEFQSSVYSTKLIHWKILIPYPEHNIKIQTAEV